jgi:hypothetical protein
MNFDKDCHFGQHRSEQNEGTPALPVVVSTLLLGSGQGQLYQINHRLGVQYPSVCAQWLFPGFPPCLAICLKGLASAAWRGRTQRISYRHKICMRKSENHAVLDAQKQPHPLTVNQSAKWMGKRIVIYYTQPLDLSAVAYTYSAPDFGGDSAPGRGDKRPVGTHKVRIYKFRCRYSIETYMLSRFGIQSFSSSLALWPIGKSPSITIRT